MAIDGWLSCKSKDSGKLLGDIRNEYYALSQVAVQEATGDKREIHRRCHHGILSC